MRWGFALEIPRITPLFLLVLLQRVLRSINIKFCNIYIYSFDMILEILLIYSSDFQKEDHIYSLGLSNRKSVLLGKTT
jgi:hypothetical protein